MTLEPREYRTSSATLTVVRPDLLEIRYDPGTIFNLQNVGEVQMKRRELMANRPYMTLTIIPEDVDYSLDSTHTDQGKPDRGEGRLLASAIVARASMIQMLTKLYFSYFPQLHRILVTDDELAARAWLDQQIREIASTGS
ncbi:MAG: hypothetical protein H6591_10580 [Flavobacteriales bacterium]|nr:hypothetical protein [Flavobacteriales bacterium]